MVRWKSPFGKWTWFKRRKRKDSNPSYTIPTTDQHGAIISGVSVTKPDEGKNSIQAGSPDPYVVEQADSKLTGLRTDSGPSDVHGRVYMASTPSLQLPVPRIRMPRSHSYGEETMHSRRDLEIRETSKIVRSIDWVTGKKMINNYMLLHEIGRGVFAKVKLAVDIETGEHYAIKIVKKMHVGHRRLNSREKLEEEEEEEEEARGPMEKIRKEVAILKKCRHPNILHLYEVINDPAREKIYLGRYSTSDHVCVVRM
jgi:hypothetical protein